MSKPRVSVGVPVYNLEQFVAEALESLRTQTLEDFEAIIVDDGSTDGSAKIIEPFLADPRFTYVYKQNAGLGAARNTALGVAKGEWFAQLDGDDLWLPDKLERQLALAESDPRANFLYGNVIVLYEDGREHVFYEKESHLKEGDITASLYTNNYLTGSSIMVKTQDLREIGGYPEQPLGEDYDTWLRLARHGIWARSVKEPIIKYRIRSGSLASDRSRNIRRQIEITQAALDREDRPHLRKILCKSIARLKSDEAYDQAGLAARSGEPGVERFLWRSWKFQPGRYRRLILALAYSLSRLSHVRARQDAVANRLRNAPTVWGPDPATLHYPLAFPIRIVAGLIRRVRLHWLVFRHRPNLRIGRKTNIRFADVRFTTKWGEINIGNECQISSGNLFAKLTIGNRVNIVGSIKLGGSGKYEVTIGDDTWIAPYVYICPSTHNCKDRNRTIREQGVWGGDITIGKDCWIGVNVVISPGVTIGDGAVIGANAVVTKDIPPYAIAVGAPARVIGYRE